MCLVLGLGIGLPVAKPLGSLCIGVGRGGGTTRRGTPSSRGTTSSVTTSRGHTSSSFTTIRAPISSGTTISSPNTSRTNTTRRASPF